MSKDLAALIDTLTVEELKKYLIAQAEKDEQLRDELLSHPQAENREFDRLRVREWKSKVLDAIKSDAVGEEDEYYALIDVNWRETVETLEEAVADLAARGLKKEALELIDEAEAKIEEEACEDSRCDFDGIEFHVEYYFPDSELSKLRESVGGSTKK